jgi:hypothetical protein
MAPFTRVITKRMLLAGEEGLYTLTATSMMESGKMIKLMDLFEN